MALPLISIIIPNFNHSLFLKQRLESVFNQTFQDFEVILLDDCSTDNSVEILTSYAKNPKVSQFIINKENSGSPFQQWKKGIDLAQGKYIWIAESDDYSEYEFLNTMITLLCNKESIGIAYCQSLIVDDFSQVTGNTINYTSQFEPNIWESSFVINGTEFIKKYLSVKTVIPNTSAVVFEKKLVDTNVFDKTLLNMSICGDWLFWIKVCSKTKIAFCDEALNSFRYHNAVTRNQDTIIKKRQRLIEEFVIRNYLLKFYSIKNEDLINKKQMEWFKLHNFFELLTNNFYEAKMFEMTYLIFATNFIKFKFLKKIDTKYGN